MKHLMLVLFVLTPAAATAQQDESTVPGGQTQPGPVMHVGEAKRRASMVGYIDDGTVESRLRLRFESGLHNDTPDRAEFFYAKCGCYRFLLPTNTARDPNAPGPGPGVVTDLNFQHVFIQGEYAIRGRFSAFGEVPVRWIQPQAFGSKATVPNDSGVGDLRVGIKIALAASDNQSVTVQLRGYLPTGSASAGLGTNHGSVEPALLYYQRFAPRLALESQIGDVHPVGGSAGNPITSAKKFSGDVFFYGVGPSYELYSGDRVRFAPVVELVGWRVLGGFQTGSPADASGINIVNLKFGGRAVIGARNSLYVGYGRGLTSAVWYTDIVRIEYRYAF